MKTLDAQQRLAGATLLVLAGVLVAVCFVRPGTTAWLPQCPFLELTGLYCPGCGTTRMLYLLMHGHPLLAARENLLATLLLPVVVARLVGRMVAGRGELIPNAWTARFGFGLALVVILFTVVRNVPAEPFRELAPVPLAAVGR